MKKTLSRLQCHYALAVAVLATFTASSAFGVPLKTLVDQGGKLVQGDKEFSNFTFVLTGAGTYNVDPSKIDVIPITVGPDHGLLFTSTVPGMPIMEAAPMSVADLVVSFDVAATAPGWAIDKIYLSFQPAEAFDGFAQIVETVKKGTQVVAQTYVHMPPGPVANSASLPVPETSVNIIKDFVVVGGTQEPTRIYSAVQLFHQIPEPMTMSLLLLGTVAFFRPRRLAQWASRRTAVIALAITVGAMGLTSRSADAAILRDLITQQGSITVGDKIFDQFSFSVLVQPSTSTSYFANDNAIDVSGIIVNGEYGIRFAGLLAAWPTPNFMFPVSNTVVRVVIGYRVTVDPSSPMYIHDMSLAFNGQATDQRSPTHPGGGYAKVEENVYGLTGQVGQLTAETPNPLSGHDNLVGLHKSLTVRKVIELDSGRGFTTISFIDQTFSQIPEPTTLALLSMALPGLLLRRRRRG